MLVPRNPSLGALDPNSPIDLFALGGRSGTMGGGRLRSNSDVMNTLQERLSARGVTSLEQIEEELA